MATTREWQFSIPKDLIPEFFSIIDAHELEVQLLEADQEDQTLGVEVSYEESEKAAVFQLIELLDEEEETDEDE